MREQINILKYGFLLFLVVAGVVSIFYKDANYVNAINSLSIPVFLFSLSIIFVKANKYARETVMKKIHVQEKTMNEKSKEISKKSEQIEKIEDDKKINYYKKTKELYKESLITTEEFIFLCKYFSAIDIFTKIFIIFAMLSFVWCLLSLVGLFAINSNFIWVNIFSLAIVFFDFFVLDDLLVKAFPKRFDKLHDQAVNKIAQEEKLNEI